MQNIVYTIIYAITNSSFQDSTNTAAVNIGMKCIQQFILTKVESVLHFYMMEKLEVNFSTWNWMQTFMINNNDQDKILDEWRGL